jgi:hypothetical protein
LERFANNQFRHCERSEAIQRGEIECLIDKAAAAEPWIASLLAMTVSNGSEHPPARPRLQYQSGAARKRNPSHSLVAVRSDAPAAASICGKTSHSKVQAAPDRSFS